MAGFLDYKKRILDTILTQEGKRQIATGDLKATFCSFTDSSTHYIDETIISGGLDATYRIMLESSNLPQDQVIFEANDQGLLNAFPVSGSDGFVIMNGQILSQSTPNGTRVTLTGSQFNSLAGNLLNTSINNFKNLQILTSPDPLDEKERQFLIGPTGSTFIISKEKPIRSTEQKIANVDNIESLFYDKRLQHIPNFQFLPPVNKPQQDNEIPTSLGEYIDINQATPQTFEELEEELREFEEMGYSETIYFTETSRENNLFGQMFELADGQLKKLDVIDYGDFPTADGTKRVYFVGKVFVDSMGSETFVNMFTLVFE